MLRRPRRLKVSLGFCRSNKEGKKGTEEAEEGIRMMIEGSLVEGKVGGSENKADNKILYKIFLSTT